MYIYIYIYTYRERASERAPAGGTRQADKDRKRKTIRSRSCNMNWATRDHKYRPGTRLCIRDGLLARQAGLTRLTQQKKMHVQNRHKRGGCYSEGGPPPFSFYTRTLLSRLPYVVA